MKVKLFVSTRKHRTLLANTLESLFQSDWMTSDHQTETYVISNHTDLSIPSWAVDKLHVLKNNCWPDTSPENLAITSNVALLMGFWRLQKPEADIVIHCQNNLLFAKDWLATLLRLHEKYTFVTGAAGWDVMSYRWEAVKKVGIWDERMSSPRYQTADYLIRALQYNKEGSSINDTAHGRLLNAEGYVPAQCAAEKCMVSNRVQGIARRSFRVKWMNTWKTSPEDNGWVTNWSDEFIKDPPSIPHIPSFVHYHYFEKDVEDLAGKNYGGFRLKS